MKFIGGKISSFINSLVHYFQTVLRVHDILHKNNRGLVNKSLNDKLKKLKRVIKSNFRKVKRVYVVPHKSMDFDCLAAAAALSELSMQNNKETFIITDDDENLMETNLKKVYSTLSARYTFINSKTLANIRTHNSKELLMVVDVNKGYLIPIEEMLPSFSRVLVIDHHNTDDKTITSNYSFIEPTMSSASEIVHNILKKSNVKIDSTLATYLLAGIYLDTRRLGILNEYICLAIAELISYGASIEDVRRLFVKTDFKSDGAEKKSIADLIEDTSVIDGQYYISVNEVNPSTIYTREILSKTADSFIEEYGATASFVMGYVDREELGGNHKNTIQISARSSKIDVCQIMTLMGGGGRPEAAATLLVTDDILSIKILLEKIIKERLYVTNDNVPNTLQLLPSTVQKL